MLTEIMIIALTLMGEAEGEPYTGKVMVAEVIINRAQVGKQSLKTVCLAPKQFSCWNGKRSEKLIARLPTLEKQASNQAWKDCKQIAVMVCKPDYKTSTRATHYFNPEKCNPKWAKAMWICASVGNHLFLREK